MNKKEVFEVLSYIKEVYKHFEVNQNTIDIWFEYLEDYELNEIKANLKNYVLKNEFPPKIKDLITYKSKYPGHQKADEILKKVERFKREKGKPPEIDIREFLRGWNNKPERGVWLETYR